VFVLLGCPESLAPEAGRLQLVELPVEFRQQRGEPLEVLRCLAILADRVDGQRPNGCGERVLRILAFDLLESLLVGWRQVLDVALFQVRIPDESLDPLEACVSPPSQVIQPIQCLRLPARLFAEHDLES